MSISDPLEVVCGLLRGRQKVSLWCPNAENTANNLHLLRMEVNHLDDVLPGILLSAIDRLLAHSTAKIYFLGE